MSGCRWASPLFGFSTCGRAFPWWTKKELSGSVCLGLDAWFGRSATASTAGPIATGGSEKDQGPTRRRALLIHHDPGSDFSPPPGLFRCRKRRSANMNTPQLERKIKLHSSARDPPPSFRAKHVVAFASVTGVWRRVGLRSECTESRTNT